MNAHRTMTRLALPAFAVAAALLLIMAMPATPLRAQSADADAQAEQAQAEQAPDSEIVVARLRYDDGKTAVCFADQFLATYARETGQNVRRGYAEIDLKSPRLFDHPFVVFSGQEAFTLSDAEKKQLKRYIDRGGFVLASAGCSNAAWARSFEAVIDELYGTEGDADKGKALQPLTTDHPLFHTVYDIDHLDIRRPVGRSAVQGIAIDGRVRVLYSPLGLNDTGNAGGECCCCGGSEIKNARLVNVNALAYALTR